MKNATEKLIAELLKISNVTIGKTATDADGIEYRHDRYTMKYDHAAYWLANMFAAAAAKNKKKNATQFSYKGYSFHFDRAKYNGQRDGKITFTLEVETSKVAA